MKLIWFNTHHQNQPILRTKDHYFGKVIKNENISKCRNILITGAHHSGKSRAINKLYEKAEDVWTQQVRPYKWSNRSNIANPEKPMLKQGETLENWTFPEPVFLHALTPLSKWMDHQGVIDWWETKHPDQPHKKLPAWRRIELLPEYLAETRALLFIDDAHKLTGRKLQIAKLCLEKAFRSVVTASDENRISPSIRRPFLETHPQIVRLNSEVAYDATHLLIWFFVVVFMLAGTPEIAMTLGAFEIFKGGRRASKQD
jgi:hypothetical protein